MYVHGHHQPHGWLITPTHTPSLADYSTNRTDHSLTTHPLTHSLTHPLTHSPTHPLTPTHSLTHSPTHPLTHSPTHPLTHSLTTHSLTTHPLTHSPTHPLTHSFTHSLMFCARFHEAKLGVGSVHTEFHNSLNTLKANRLTDSRTHSLTHSLTTPSLTGSLTLRDNSHRFCNLRVVCEFVRSRVRALVSE